MAATRVCGRIGCAQPAVGVLLLAAPDCEAWLVGLTHEAAPEGVPLCESHADRIRVPSGWGLHDERPARKPTRRRRTRRTARPELDASENAGEKEPAPSDGTREEEPLTASEPVDPDAVEAGEVADGDVADGDEGSEGEAGTADTDETSEVEATDDDPVRSLQVLEGGDEEADTTVFEDGGQGSLWAPNDSMPLLQRAFRIVRDD